ncbi:TonB-linked SusC/RagA family outer membrane protein [Gelidibacter sediminis]|uniref:TonB-linked SusC/RagA family outer membrane protein n=1 Tax=Gelidibacter sediminis TaxID=1608710 RepID=A0A4V3F938_9FLAO|nr:TonB-dependent receptor [Gelidibacter sediminis]TDU42856.1 TonB-linked SusC/RagA family outer membrane protein [Gelidibacter sediminis]
MKTKFSLILTLCLVLIAQITFAQQKTISGTVSDESGIPLPGVNILVKGTTTGTQTDFDGKFSISAKVGDVLSFSFVGLQSKEVTVTSSNTINLTMAEDAAVLDEVVVVGYGVQKKSEVTGAISSISGSDLQGLVTPSFESQLAGRAAGVQVTSNNGIIGEAPRIRIRGIASIGSGTSPLIVVDGMPIYSGNVGGYASANGLGDINPNDIESYEILKDGAATAIYGSRAANGVILITTKKGKRGAMKVSYNNVTGFAQAIKTFDLLETPDFILISNEKRTNRNQTAWAVGNEFNTDWQDAVLNSNALQTDHSLSFNGGSDATKYFFSMGYANQEGVAVANSLARYNLRASLEHNLNKWLTIGGSIAVTRTEYEGLNTGMNSLSGNIFNATRQLPNTPIFNADHPSGYNLSSDSSVVGQWDNTDPVGDNISNIAYVLAKNKYKSKVNRTIVNTFASIDLFDGLNYRFQASADNPLTSGFLYWNPVHGDGRGSNGRLQNNNTDLLRWNIQNILSYNKSFADAHNVGATLVAEYQKEKNQSFFGVGTDLLDEFYNQNLVTNAYGTQESGGSVTENGIISYVGRISYNYKQRYFLQGSIRRDGISKLSEAKRWNNFTGYSAGWNIANEEFFRDIKGTINEFKIRASYSEVGNTEIGSYPYLGLTSASQYGTLNGIAFTQFGNDQLLWETSKKTDFGLDLGMFNNKLRFNFDYYKNDIDGLILDVPIAASLGVPGNRVKKNIGAMSNKGYEFGVDYRAVSNAKFNWNITANLTMDKNEVLSIPDGQDILGGTFSDANIAQNLIIREGQPINSIYGYKYYGVNPANGNPVYYKADGTLVQGNLATATYFVFDPSNPSDLSQASSLSAGTDRVILGTTLPKYYGSVINRFTYDAFDLTFMFRFSGGNKIFNSTRRDLVTQNLNNNSTEILGRWQSVENPGDGVTPRLWASSNTFTNLTGVTTSRFLEDGDFISLDNLTLGYQIPKSFTDRVKVDMIRLFVQGQNLLTITDYKGLNPEMESGGVDLNGTPRAKILSFGLNVNL